MEKVNITSLADIEALEKVPFDERLTATNTYDILKEGAAINPDATAISFMLTGATYTSPMQITYRELMS
ncbi:MAG: acyl-CoA synthetase, partial [Deltaproteobacteria bacterium]|nr:acyl-CoA synthetase [Deltaproteobacteria bacterium]